MTGVVTETDVKSSMIYIDIRSNMTEPDFWRNVMGIYTYSNMTEINVSSLTEINLRSSMIEIYIRNDITESGIRSSMIDTDVRNSAT